MSTIVRPLTEPPAGGRGVVAETAGAGLARELDEGFATAGEPATGEDDADDAVDGRGFEVLAVLDAGVPAGAAADVDAPVADVEVAGVAALVRCGSGAAVQAPRTSTAALSTAAVSSAAKLGRRDVDGPRRARPGVTAMTNRLPVVRVRLAQASRTRSVLPCDLAASPTCSS
ncbi:hypothetical protein M6D93_18165 [Jatrophihabitans telluris]|uniref:Uncharacterized protein n=1 Tax=Jatrophihabitans telluris TaxID=2038343 RepID=A0ABY4QY93_9ACTN|nr:hypothetical protein [Jatrophihabitans telluris]UQX88192.1 hypothetical protein M6D93_18165 [Jatrophihabitans telluris]